MQRKIGSGFKAVPALYALLIILFLFLHFSRFEDFSLVTGNVSFKGTSTSGTGIAPPRISRLAVFTNGLELNFSSRAPLTVITEDGIRRTLFVKNMESGENGITLYFKYDISIRIESEPAGTNSFIEVSVPRTIPPVTELILSARPLESFLLNLDGQSRITLSDGTSTFFLNMTDSDLYDSEKEQLTIRMDNRTISRVALEDEAPGLGRSVREWLTGDEIISSGEEAGILNEFRLKSYNGWKSRFDKNLGQWKMTDGTAGFNEKILVLTLAEAFRRNEQSLVLSDLIKSAERHSTRLTWYSSPYTGDIVNKGAPLLRNDPEQLLAALYALPRKGNPELSPSREISELQSRLDNGASEDIVPWIEENLYPLLVWLEEGLYIFHPDNPVSDTVLSLRASMLLKEAGSRTGNEELIRIGRKLLVSVLNRADDRGFLPETVSFSRERPSLEEGIILPEEIFGLFLEAPFTPRIMDIDGAPGKGGWLFSTAESAQVKTTPGYMDIDLTYPKGQIHHLIIKGVQPFSRIMLHGIRWKSDPRFQRYSDGWVYDSVNKTLYVKIRQRTSKETVRILFNPPEPAPAPAAPVPAASEGTAETTE